MSKKARRNNDQTRGPLRILVLMPVIEDICQGSEGLPEPHYITEEAAKRVSERSLALTLRKLAEGSNLTKRYFCITIQPVARIY